MIVINQGKPVSKRFKLFVPISFLVTVDDPVLCRHPISGVETSGTIYDMITVAWHKVPNWICLEAYNRNLPELKKILEQKYPAHRDQEEVRILLIKETQPS